MATTRKALGRGLSALLGESAAPRAAAASPSALAPHADGFQMVPLSQIERNAGQPRKKFDAAAIQELAESIRTHGVLQPVLLIRKGDARFEILAGERRCRAAKEAGLKSVPALVRPAGSPQDFEVALVENLQREDLSPLEEAFAYRLLHEERGLTHDDIGRRVGKSRSHVTNVLRLLKLPAETQAQIDKGAISLGQAKVLAGMSEAEQKKLTAKILKEKTTVRQAEQQKAKASAPATLSADLRSVEAKLRDHLQTKVQLKPKAGSKQQGTLEIEWYGQEDLDRLLRLLRVRLEP